MNKNMRKIWVLVLKIKGLVFNCFIDVKEKC